jgi:hypothetical protein
MFAITETVPAFTLATLTWGSGGSVSENSVNGTTVGSISGRTSGSTLTLLENAGGRFAVDSASGIVSVANGTLLDYEASTSHTITVRETATGATNSPRDTVLTIVVNNDVSDDAVPAATVQYLWTGVPTTDGVYASVKLNSTGSANSARLAVSTSPDLSSPVYSDAVVPDATFRIAKFSVTGLAESTTYYYGVEVDGVVDTVTTGFFKTLPSGPTSFTFSAGCCLADGLSTTDATNAILARSSRPLFHVLHGDMHYGDVLNNHPSPTEADFQNAFDSTFAVADKHSFFRNIPQVYTWDDHDFLYNNTGGYASSGVKMTGRDLAVAAHRRRAPHPLASATAGDAIYYSFVCGRLRFIVTDDRADRTDVTQTPRTILSSTQMQWVKDEITAAAAAGQAVCLVVSSIWGALSTTADTWGAYASERTAISDHIKSSGMSGKTFIIAGDGHQMAISTTVDFATGGGAAVPVFQAAPLWANTAGGLSSSGYTYGPVPAGGTVGTTQYGIVDVTDDGSTMTISLKGYSPDGTQLMSYSFSPFAVVGGGNFAASGGTYVEPGDGYGYWEFTSSGTLNVTASGSVEYLILAGGGAGGASSTSSGGGGAGGLLTGTSSLAIGSHAISVGAGGLGSTGSGAVGEDSSVEGIAGAAIGGGSGRSGLNAPFSGGSGAGGGGTTTGSVAGSAATSGQGNPGGAGISGATAAIFAAGGGGGYGSAGQDASSGKGGDGGDGVTIWGRYTVAGGGGGSSGNTGTYQGQGKAGGGSAVLNAAGQNAAANSGSGGGAIRGTTFNSGNGGSGLVVFRVPLSAPVGTYLYKGAELRANKYKGAKTDAQIYKGAKTGVFAS